MLSRTPYQRWAAGILGILGGLLIVKAHRLMNEHDREKALVARRAQAHQLLLKQYAGEKDITAMADTDQLIQVQEHVRQHGLDAASFEYLYRFAGDETKDRVLRQRAIASFVKPIRENQIPMSDPRHERLLGLARRLLADKEWTMRIAGLSLIAGYRDKGAEEQVRLLTRDPDVRVSDFAKRALDSLGEAKAG